MYRCSVCQQESAYFAYAKCSLCGGGMERVEIGSSSQWVTDSVTTYGDEVRVTDPVTGGEKGQKQAQLGGIDPLALLELAKVAGYGNTKYERYNFAKGYKWSLSYDALQRHLMAFWSGEDKDTESGLYHVAQASWHCLALLSFLLREKGTDDRFPQ